MGKSRKDRLRESRNYLLSDVSFDGDVRVRIGEKLEAHLKEWAKEAGDTYSAYTRKILIDYAVRRLATEFEDSPPPD